MTEAKTMRIMYVTNSFRKTSGWERYGFELLPEALRAGHDVRAIVHRKSEGSDIRQAELLAEPKRYLSNPWVWLKALRDMNREIADFRPDVIHFIVEPYVQALPYLRYPSATRVILTVHGTYAVLSDVLDDRLKKMVSRINYETALGRVTAIAAVSGYTKGYMLERIAKLFGSKLFVIHSGCDRLALPDAPSLERTREKFGLTGTGPILCTVGAIKPRKGQLDSLRAFAIVRRRYPHASYIMVGNEADAGYVATIRAEAKALGVEDAVRIADDVRSDEGLAGIYAISDIILLNSTNDGNHFEGFGLIILEANQFGKPALGSMGCGIEDAIKDGINGHLTRQGDSPDIAEKIFSLLEKPLDPVSIKDFADGFTWSETFKGYDRLYRGADL